MDNRKEAYVIMFGISAVCMLAALLMLVGETGIKIDKHYLTEEVTEVNKFIAPVRNITQVVEKTVVQKNEYVLDADYAYTCLASPGSERMTCYKDAE